MLIASDQNKYMKKFARKILIILNVSTEMDEVKFLLIKDN